MPNCSVSCARTLDDMLHPLHGTCMPPRRSGARHGPVGTVVARESSAGSDEATTYSTISHHSRSLTLLIYFTPRLVHTRNALAFCPQTHAHTHTRVLILHSSHAFTNLFTHVHSPSHTCIISQAIICPRLSCVTSFINPFSLCSLCQKVLHTC